MTGIRGQRSVEGLLVDWSVAQQLPDRGVPVALLTQAQKAAELQRVQARRAMDAAYEAELVMGLADDTPDTLDPPPGHPGARKGSWAPDTELPGVSEFFVPELAVVLDCGRGTAAHLAHRAFTYRHDLPATRAALAAGVLDQARAKALADALAHTTPATAQAIEARLLGEATGLSLRRLRDKALALLLEHDADAIDKRREDAGRQADVRCYPSHREGMATLAAELPADEAAEGYDLIDRLAQMAKADGDARPIGQIRAEIFSLLIRRPADHGLPAVRAEVTVTAALDALEGSSTTPGQVNGQPITAAHVRALLARIGALDLQAPEGGSLTLAITDAEDRLLASASPAQLARLARRGCRTHPRRRLRVFGPGPAGADQRLRPHRRPTRLRHHPRPRLPLPQLRPRVGWADRDHVIPHADGGATDCANLCCLCRSHHRLKTLARGWRFVMTPDGVLHVTTPSGVTRTTRPPGMRAPTAEPTEPAPTDAENLPLTAPDDDPPPF